MIDNLMMVADADAARALVSYPDLADGESLPCCWMTPEGWTVMPVQFVTQIGESSYDEASDTTTITVDAQNMAGYPFVVRYTERIPDLEAQSGCWCVCDSVRAGRGQPFIHYKSAALTWDTLNQLKLIRPLFAGDDYTFNADWSDASLITD